MAVPIYSFQRKFAVSKIPQTNYATPTAGDANFKQVLVSDESFVSEQPNIANNRNYAKGSRQATESWLVNHDATVSFPFDICFEEIGRFLLLAFGKVVTTQPDAVNSPTVYQHVFSPMDPLVAAQPPVTTFIEQCGAALDALFPSVACQSLVLSGEGPQRLGAQFAGAGSGKKVSPSGIVIAALANLHYAYQSQVKLTLDDGTVLTNAATAPQRLNRWSFGVNNQLGLDDGFRPGAAAFQESGNPDSGEVRTEALFQDQSFDLSFNLRLLNDSVFLDALTAQTPIEAIVEITGPVIEDAFNNSLKIEAFKAPYRTINKQPRNGLLSVDIVADVQYDTSVSKDVQVTLINNVASYLV